MFANERRFRKDNERRVDRMKTWIALAEDTRIEHVQFVFYWIAYEAAFQNYKKENNDGKQRKRFHERLARRDGVKLSYILNSQHKYVAEILTLRQAHPSFWYMWDEDKNVKHPEEWEGNFKSRVESVIDSLNKGETLATLNNLFDNLAIVRNQIVHGASAGPRSLGQTQVGLGARLLKALVPSFRDSIQSRVYEDWGKPPFPRVGSEGDEECPPPWLDTERERTRPAR